MNFDTIIYHSACSDGTAALWAANYYKNINEKIACKAGINAIVDPTNKNILYVDLCPNLDYLIQISKLAKSIVILDHHKSAQDMLNKNKNNIPSNVNIILDMTRAGCQMVWDYFFPNQSRPWFIDYIADRDLWTWNMPDSKAINTALFDGEYIDSYNLDKLTNIIKASQEMISNFVTQGNMLLRIQKKELDQSANRAVESTMNVNGIIYNVWVGNCSSALRSDLGNILSTKPLSSGSIPDFSATWVYDFKSNEWWISLRGHKESPDLSAICGVFGGGGHRAASGMTIKAPKTLGDFFKVK